MKSKNFFLASLLVPVLICSCTKDPLLDPEINSNDLVSDKWIKVGDVLSSASAFSVQFYAEDSLFVGYNKVHFKISDKGTGKPLTEAAIELLPLMDMVTFKHACPVENPGTTAGTDGFFNGAVLFSMQGLNNTWSLSAKINSNGKNDSVFFPISKVMATVPVKKIVIIDSLSTGPGTWKITKHPVSLIPPAQWKVGNNTFEITIHTMASMMSFPPFNDMTVEINPEMPSMGHGSPNNVNPVLTQNGHYAGIVNFTMTGSWRVNMTFKKAGRTIGRNAYFDITF